MSNRFAAFRHSSYRRYFISRFGSALAGNILSVTVAWQVYDQTGNPLYLGWIGLMQFLPALLLVLVTGLAADKFGRRTIMGLATFIQMVCSLLLLGMTVTGNFSIPFVLCVVSLLGVGRAFYLPSASSLVVNIVPREDFPNAVGWNASSWQMASILGPSIGGVLTAFSVPLAYIVAAGVWLLTASMIFTIPKPDQARMIAKTTLTTLLGGFRYIWKTKIVLGAITLDLFAVLLGGAVALLPVYAKDVLQIGEAGYGVMRAAPGIGALTMVFVITSIDIKKNAGLILFVFTALFGLVHIIFGYSEIVWISVIALVLIGATDMMSVYVRETLLQLWTPDDVRGRVNAVNSIVIGASNQIGEARAGFMAARWGAVFTVVAGGYAAIGVSVLWAVLFPDLRKVQNMDEGAQSRDDPRSSTDG